DNSASILGGGLGNNGAATLDRVTVTGNTHMGIYNQGDLTLTNSSLYNNEAVGNVGGGIFNESNRTVYNNTIRNNHTTESGGGLFNSGTASLLATTIAGNLADAAAQGGWVGGGIANNGALVMGNTLLADNYISHTLSECSGNGITSLDYNDVEGGG